MYHSLNKYTSVWGQPLDDNFTFYGLIYISIKLQALWGRALNYTVFLVPSVISKLSGLECMFNKCLLWWCHACPLEKMWGLLNLYLNLCRKGNNSAKENIFSKAEKKNSTHKVIALRWHDLTYSQETSDLVLLEIKVASTDPL